MTIPEGTKAMIFAAGLGTRLKPFTDSHPKALAVVNGKPLLQRNIEYLKSFGVSEMIINVHHFADQIINFLDNANHFGCNIVISHEIEEPLETGGGLKKAEWFFESAGLPFYVLNADILTNLDLKEMYQFHLQQKGLATLAVTLRQSSRSFLFDDYNLLCGWENKLTGEKKIALDGKSLHAAAFTTIHLIEPSMLKKIKQFGRFSIIDTYLDLALSENIYGFDHSGDIVVDVGRPESIAIAEKYFI